jgi:hypothetical protein
MSDIDIIMESMLMPENHQQLFIVIHSLDSGQLKEDGVQDLLAELASIQQIKMIVSLDHFASSRLWNNQQLDKFGFYTLQIDTFMPYIKEI